MSTTEPTTRVGNVSIVKKFFGLKENQTMTQFAAEWKELSDKDKTELTEGIENESLTY